MTKAKALRHGPRFAVQLNGLHQMDARVTAESAVVTAALAWWLDPTPCSSAYARMCLPTWSTFTSACARLAQNAPPSAITCVHGTSEELCEQCWPAKETP